MIRHRSTIFFCLLGLCLHGGYAGFTSDLELSVNDQADALVTSTSNFFLNDGSFVAFSINIPSGTNNALLISFSITAELNGQFPDIENLAFVDIPGNPLPFEITFAALPPDAQPEVGGNAIQESVSE